MPRIQLHENFRVGGCPKDGTISAKLLAEVPEVVDLSIENDRVSAVSRLEWLVGTWIEIQNCKPSMPQGNALTMPGAHGIRTAVCHGVVHRRDNPLTVGRR